MEYKEKRSRDGVFHHYFIVVLVSLSVFFVFVALLLFSLKSADS